MVVAEATAKVATATMSFRRVRNSTTITTKTTGHSR